MRRSCRVHETWPGHIHRRSLTSSSSRYNPFEAWLQRQSKTPERNAAALEEHFHAEANLLGKVVRLITSFRRWGHMAAKTDPLGLSNPSEIPSNLRLEGFGFTGAQLSSAKPVDVSTIAAGSGFTSSDRSLPLSELHARLRDVYAGTVGVEYMHIRSQGRRDWLRDRLETVSPPAPSDAERFDALEKLCWADSFAGFCGQHFRHTKRFGLEGCESLIVGMNGIVERAGEHGVEYVVMGMPHRGRLNVLANVARKPLTQIFRDFRGVVKGTPVANDEWRAMTEAAFEQLCSEGRGGRLRVDEASPCPARRFRWPLRPRSSSSLGTSLLLLPWPFSYSSLGSSLLLLPWHLPPNPPLAPPS